MRNIRLHKYQDVNCKSYCPHCGYGPLVFSTGATFYETEAAAAFAQELDPNPIVLPQDGDVTICAKCANILIYVIKEETSVRPINDEELAQLKQNPHYETVEKVINAVRGRNDYKKNQ